MKPKKTRDYKYLCLKCGEGMYYLSSIAGTNHKHCEGCGKTGLLYKYEWPQTKENIKPLF